jgi:exosortase/archaeosortase family protein
MTTPAATLEPRGLAERRRTERRVADQQARQLMFRLGTAVLAIVVAYHHSIEQLAMSVEDDGPLAYLGLIPILAGAAMVHNVRRLRLEGNLSHWHADWMVGLPLLAAAWVMGPPAAQWFGYVYWEWCVDLVSLPLFAGGVTALLFGSRVLRSVRGPIAMLALACRAPYLVFLDPLLDATTALTVDAVSLGSRVLPFVDATGLGATFVVGEAGTADSFLVVVATSCSGANGVIAFALVGAAIATRLVGSPMARVRWLLSGAAIVWAVNLLRIIAILTTGALLGQRAAFGALHSTAGLIGFVLAVLISLGRLGRCGLELRSRDRSLRPSARRARRDKLATSATAAGWLAFPTVLVATVVLGAFNLGVWRYDRFFTAVNNATVVGLGTTTPGLDGAPMLNGWTHAELEDVGWASQFFGPGAEWRRTALLSTHDSTIVSFDTIRTTELRNFATHSIAACYLFHGFEMSTPSRVGLNGGVNAELARFHDDDTWWLTLSWIWSVTDTDTEFERPVLLVRVPGEHDTPPAELSGLEDRLVDLANQLVLTGDRTAPISSA